MRTNALALLWRDTRNYLQSQLAVRIPGIYCPSLFGHHGREQRLQPALLVLLRPRA